MGGKTLDLGARIALVMVVSGLLGWCVGGGAAARADVPELAPAAAASPPPGWHVTNLTPPTWAGQYLLRDGVLVASTELLGRGEQILYDVYRLRAPGEGGPVGTVLKGAVEGYVYALDEGLVVYGVTRPGTDPDAYMHDLYVRDLGSGATTKIPLPSDAILSPWGPPTVDGGIVVFSFYGGGREPEVTAFDTATGRLWTITPDPKEAHGSPFIDGDDVVWQAWNGQTHRVLHHDLRTGRTTQLAADLRWSPGLAPRVSDGRVVWVRGEWVTPVVREESVFLHDLRDGSTEMVDTVRGPRAGATAQVSGDLLVTLLARDGVAFELAVRDLSTGSSRVLAELGPVDGGGVGPGTADGLFTWQESVELPGGSGYTGKILAYDAAGGTVETLAEGPRIGHPVTSLGRVVFSQWVDSVSSKLWLAERDDAPPYERFLDVPADAPYHDAILDFAARGLVAGYETGDLRTFHPRHPLRRAQLAKILVNALGLPVAEGMTPPFRDLGPDPADDLYPHQYVAAATAAGLLKGYSATAFGPWAELTRAQMVTVLVRGVERLDAARLAEPPAWYTGSVTGAPPVHAANIRVAEYNGLLADLDGFGPGWDPNIYARRGEVVQALYSLGVLVGR